VDAVGEDGVLVEALGLDGVVGDAAGGGDGGGELAGGDVCCASALVNANALTAAAAMTCFNMSASWGNCEWIHGRQPRSRRPASPTREPSASSGSETR
jgi:hypothetical protein